MSSGSRITLFALLLSVLPALANGTAGSGRPLTFAGTVLRRHLDLQDGEELPAEDLEDKGALEETESEEPGVTGEELPAEKLKDTESDESGVATEKEPGDESLSEDEEPEQAPEERECELKAKKDDERVYKCKAKVKEGGMKSEDEIKFKVELKDSSCNSLKVEVEYSQEVEIETEETETETESETKYDVCFVKLVEYVSASGSFEAYSWEDEILQEFPLEFNDLADVTTSEDGVTSTFSATTTNNLAKFSFTISQADMGETLDANKMKIDLTIAQFPWTEGRESSIALISYVESNREVETKADGSKKTVEDIEISFAGAVDTVGFVPFGEFTWVKTADAINSAGESEEIDVIATSPAALPADTSTSQALRVTTSVEDIAFSFVGAQGSNSVFWDPSAGVAYAATERGDEGDTSGSGAVSSSFFGALIIVASFLF